MGSMSYVYFVGNARSRVQVLSTKVPLSWEKFWKLPFEDFPGLNPGFRVCSSTQITTLGSPAECPWEGSVGA